MDLTLASPTFRLFQGYRDTYRCLGILIDGWLCAIIVLPLCAVNCSGFPRYPLKLLRRLLQKCGSPSTLLPCVSKRSAAGERIFRPP